jgi:hypothetical protein
VSGTEPVIWSDENFEIRLPNRPHVDRDDGGHLVVYPKRDVSFRSELPVQEAQALAVLLQALEEAYLFAMRARGLDMVWLNIQDNGNWSLLTDKPRHFHVHLYGRCRTEHGQTPGQALVFPDPHSAIYDEKKQLDEGDIAAIIDRLEANIQKLASQEHGQPYPLR